VINILIHSHSYDFAFKMSFDADDKDGSKYFNFSINLIIFYKRYNFLHSRLRFRAMMIKRLLLCNCSFMQKVAKSFKV